MGISTYKKEVSPGNFKTFYLVVAEAINKYTGKRIQKKRRSITSEVKAERAYRELWSLCREERPDGLRIINWGELKDQYITFIESKVRSNENPSGFSPHVIATKKSRLKHTSGWRETHLELITPAFVRDQFDKLELQGVSRVMTSDIQKEVKCIMSFAVDLGVLPTNCLTNMKARKVPKRRKEALTHDEVDRLLLEAKRRNHPYYLVWLMTLITGLRRSELAGLRWTDIDFDHGLIQVRRQILPREGLVNTTKDKEERVVAIPSQTIPTLKQFRLAGRSEYVVALNCHRWTSGQQAVVLREFCREIGIKEVTHHQLRATYITLAIIDGVPLGIVKENVGHAKLSTTDEYFRSSGIQLRGQTDGLKIRLPQETQGIVLPLKVVEK